AIAEAQAPGAGGPRGTGGRTPAGAAEARASSCGACGGRNRVDAATAEAQAFGLPERAQSKSLHPRRRSSRGDAACPAARAPARAAQLARMTEAKAKAWRSDMNHTDWGAEDKNEAKLGVGYHPKNALIEEPEGPVATVPVPPGHIINGPAWVGRRAAVPAI